MSNLDSAAEKISGLLSPEDPEQPESEAAAPEEEQGAEELETGSEAPGDEPEGDEGGDESARAIVPPSFLSDQERAAFEGAPPEIQQWIIRRHKDQESGFTKKSQELSAKSKEAESAAAAAAEARQKYLSALEALPTEQPPHSEESLVELKEANPVEWVKAIEENRLFKESRAELQAERNKALKEQQEAAAKQMADAIVEAAKELPNLIPEWADEEVASKEKSANVTYLKDQGYDDGVISAIADPRIIAMVNKARKWDELQAGKVTKLEKVRKAPKMGSPGTSQGKTNVKELDTLKDKLKKSGKVGDAAALIAARMKG